jgi:hypothetical protein
MSRLAESGGERERSRRSAFRVTFLSAFSARTDLYSFLRCH